VVVQAHPLYIAPAGLDRKHRGNKNMAIVAMVPAGNDITIVI